MEQRTNMLNSSYYLPNEFINKMLKKIRDFELLKKKERNFYIRLPYNERESRLNICIQKDYIYKLVRLMRIAFMYLNKNKYKVFTYSSMKFWKIASSKKNINIEDIEKQLKIYDFNSERKKYLKMCINTFKKYDDSYGMFVACVAHRLFYYDIACVILEYI